MRKPDEVLLFAALRARQAAFRNPGIFAIEQEAERLGIPVKRAYALVSKWSDRGWWDYGVSLRGGWFTPEAPESLKP